MRLIAASIALATALCGCTNTVYFYETEKFTLLTVEGRPDPSQPAELTVGFKQRVVVVSPPAGTDGDAASTLGKFYLDRRPEKKDSNGNVTDAGGVTVKTSLFTGKAATELPDAQKVNVLKGLAISEWRDLASKSIQTATKNDQLAALGDVAKADFNNVDYAKVKASTGLEQANFTRDLHEAIRVQLGISK